MATLHALLYASKAYSYAKNNFGPLKPKVETIEGTLGPLSALRTTSTIMFLLRS
ncbi:putative rubber elongation factor [Helianthus annuus]|uniref:Rubber elongation factor n=1 Tax=Helianthus annuus TaxID=4232 RepID=A0A9K3IEU9_HELAN|nr:putative rubber elongation factor [Helianthus annuus]KAJ0553439.1 putative rubber elongation factor [Helianthus annuus]KAJ0719099.1 putative rubber elongation factor [Helianthus annuus]KAJ0722354.1 putative rubber elongation factor [Helianthus annuus]KAJ0954161.1 putative rubber elongation factor [Helianthus annuus]